MVNLSNPVLKKLNIFIGAFCRHAEMWSAATGRGVSKHGHIRALQIRTLPVLSFLASAMKASSQNHPFGQGQNASSVLGCGGKAKPRHRFQARLEHEAPESETV